MNVKQFHVVQYGTGKLGYIEFPLHNVNVWPVLLVT